MLTLKVSDKATTGIVLKETQLMYKSCVIIQKLLPKLVQYIQDALIS